MDQQKGLLTTVTGTSQPKRTKCNELGTQEHWNTWNMGTDASARRDHRKGQKSLLSEVLGRLLELPALCHCFSVTIKRTKGGPSEV